MATINDQFFNDLAGGATWSAGVAFKRSNPLPLDRYSVFASKVEAETYATTNAVAYPGQVIAIVENGEMVVYVLNEVADEVAEGAEQTYHLGLKQVGTVPTGDGKTIAVDKDGKISLLVAAGDTEAGSQLTLQADGTIKWVKPDTSTAEGQTAAIKALQDTVNGTEDTEGLVEKVGAATDGETAATGLYKLIADEEARAEAAEEALGKRIDAINYVDASTYATDKEALEEAIQGAQDAADAAQKSIDDFLEGTGAEGVIDTLTEIQAALEDLTDATELATAIAGKADKVANAVEGNFAGLDANGNLTDSGKKASDFATPADVATAKSEAMADADSKLEDKADKATTLAGYGITDAYTAAQTDAAILAKIGEMTGGESAADVLGLLNAYKASNDREVWGDEFVTSQTTDGKYEPSYTGDSRIDTLEKALDALEAVGAQANVIEAVVAKAGNTVLGTTEIVTADKTVTIDDSKIVAAIAEAKTAGTDAAAAAQSAQNKADTNATAIEGLAKNLTDNYVTNTLLSNSLAAYLTGEQVAETYLDKTTAGQTYLSKTDAADTYLDKTTASSTYATQASVNTLSGRVDNLSQTVDNKANSSEVYTKTEIGTIAEGKTIVQMIADAQAAATYDDTAVKADIKTNADAIAAIYKAADGDVAESGVLVDKIAAEKARAEAAEKANADEIARVNGVLVDAIENNAEGLDSIKELADWINTHGTEASGMATAISANTAAIEAINDGTTGILATAKAYTDTQIPAALVAYKVKDVDNKTLQLSDAGIVSVKAISTDLLVQGTEELILNGGTAV